MRPALDFSQGATVGRPRPPSFVRRYGEDPGPGFTAIPYTDTASSGLIDGSAHDPGATLSVLVSLAAEVEARIPDAVWLARVRHGYSWGQVAERLGLVTETVRRRYGDYVRACTERLS
jgi:hypothetical protein